MLQDCDKCRKFATEITGEGVAPKTDPNNLNERIMKQYMNEQHEVWVMCEFWSTPEGDKFETYSNDIKVFSTLDGAVEEWKRRIDDRMNREGCKVTGDIEVSRIHPIQDARDYIFSNEHDDTFNVRTLFLRKTYCE